MIPMQAQRQPLPPLQLQRRIVLCRIPLRSRLMPSLSSCAWVADADAVLTELDTNGDELRLDEENENWASDFGDEAWDAYLRFFLRSDCWMFRVRERARGTLYCALPSDAQSFSSSSEIDPNRFPICNSLFLQTEQHYGVTVTLVFGGCGCCFRDCSSHC